MSDAERAIGRLEGKVDLILKEQAELRKDVQSLKDTRSLSKGYKAALLAVASALGGLAGFLTNLF